VYVSIDASEMAVHEENRGLAGLGERIRSATARMPSLGMTALAQVTMSKLIGDYRTLVPLLRNLGFSAVAFSYPQQACACRAKDFSDRAQRHFHTGHRRKRRRPFGTCQTRLSAPA
jgi:hypothetical protein